MGIKGLTSYIDFHNTTLLKDFTLQDCHLVVDGNNLYHFLYHHHQVDCNCGGDYSEFADCVERFFTKLQQCGVCAYVVLDGADPPDERKLQTSLSRFKYRISQAGKIAKGGNGRVLPILAQETFIAVLQKMRIKHVTCNYEADQQVAALANKLQCPVLSNDSDFFVCNLSGGFLVLDYLDPKLKQADNGTMYLMAQCYHLETFLTMSSLRTPRMMALFATLMGNDIIPEGTFINFYASGALKKSKKKHHCASTHSQITSLTNWLDKCVSYDTAVNVILSCYSEKNRNNISELIKASVSSYVDLETDLYHYFSEDTHDVQAALSYCGMELPVWVQKSWFKSTLPTLILDAIAAHRVFLMAQPEDMNKPSAYDSTLHLRRMLYGILLAPEAAVCDTQATSSKKRSGYIEEITRGGQNVKKRRVEAMHQLPSGHPLPNLHQVATFTLEERLTILLRALASDHVPQFSSLDSLPHQLQLVTLALRWWVLNSETKVTMLHMMAVTVGIVRQAMTNITDSGLNSDQAPLEETNICREMLQFCGVIGQKDRQNSVSSASETFFETMRIECTESLQTLESFCEKSAEAENDENHCRVMHVLSSFQVALQATMHLNTVLQEPLLTPLPQLMYHGSFIVALYHGLSKQLDAHQHVVNLLGGGTTIGTFWDSWLSLLVQSVPEESFGASCQTEKKHQRRKEKRKHWGTTEGTGTNSTENRVVVSCDVSNKFSALFSIGDQ